VTVLVGTSGWHYMPWKGRFYPREVRSSDWLDFYSPKLQTVELNSAFYRLPTREGFETWAARVPDDFVFAVKASRYLTHVQRLQSPGQPVAKLMAAVAGLGDALGPVLLQLPPNLKADPELLAAALRAFPRTVRVAVESRHPSWHDDRIRKVLETYRSAWVWVDPSDRSRPLWRTTNWGYVRFHRGTGTPDSCYNRSPLETWARRLFRAEDLYCYFNNDGNGCAPRDARRFAGAARRVGLLPSRVPRPRETPLAGSAERST
jgi:uncharacterized protein YecE (DUF72 family)